MSKFVRDGYHIGIMIYEVNITSLNNGSIVDHKVFLMRKNADKMFNKMSAQIHYNGDEDEFTASYGGEVLWIT